MRTLLQTSWPGLSEGSEGHASLGREEEKSGSPEKPTAREPASAGRQAHLAPSGGPASSRHADQGSPPEQQHSELVTPARSLAGGALALVDLGFESALARLELQQLGPAGRARIPPEAGLQQQATALPALPGTGSGPLRGPESLSPVTRESLRIQGIDCSSRQNRSLVQRVPAENTVAKAWWQYAIGCVAKENRQKSSGNWNEFQVGSATKRSYFKALRLLLFKVVDESARKEEIRGPAG